MKKLLIILFFVVGFQSVAQTGSSIDSLYQVILAADDSSCVRAYI